MWDSNADRSLRADRRGVSAVIGVVLMLAVAMLLVSVLQAAAIPALNAQHEFQHSQAVQTDMVQLESTVDRVAATGTGETATVDLGLRYPPRLLFVNPPPVSGGLSTTEPGTVTIENARAAGETGDYWDGTDRTFTTTSLAYTPDYNEYGSAPVTVYEPWAVYNRIDGRTLPVSGTDLIEGRRISLVALDGAYADSSADTVGVDADPNSAPVRTVTVSDDGEPITLTIPTGLRNDSWARLLESELDPAGTDDDRHVRRFSCQREPPAPCGELTVTLEPGTYDLRLGEVAVGTGSSRTTAAYLTDVEGGASSITEAGRQRLTVEARDRYDNPVSGVTVTGSVDGDGSLRAVSPVTDSDGRATFVYEAPDAINGTRDVSVTTQFGDGRPEQTVEFGVRVVDVAGGAGDAGPGTDGPAGGPTTSADSVAGVDGSVDSANLPGRNRGREATFAVSTPESVTLTGFSVETQNGLDGRPFVDRDTTFGGDTLPVTFSGELAVALRDIDASGDLGISAFVDPASPEADIVVTLSFADGSTRTLGLG